MHSIQISDNEGISLYGQRKQSFATATQHCFIFHGHEAFQDLGKPTAMKNIIQAIQRHPSSNHWVIWNVIFKTQSDTFKTSAKKVATLIEKNGIPLSRTVMFGYSMGGLVARQMIADGLPCQALITVCTPHLGLAPWVPILNKGALSMTSTHPDLIHLNRCINDRKMRDTYHLFCIYYRFLGHRRSDDKVVMLASALGYTLGGHIAYRLDINVPQFSDIVPHMEGMDASRIRPAMQCMYSLLGNND